MRRSPLTGAAVASRGGAPVWSGVDLGVARGEFVAVLGPNGAGKSTFLDLVLGLLPPSAGVVSVLGEAPSSARTRIGYLPQRRSFDASTRVRGVDIVRLGLDGARWGLPLARGAQRLGARRPGEGRRGRRAGRRRRLRRAADRRPLRRRAAAPADRPGAGPRPRDAAPRRAARQPRPPQPGGGRGAGPADLPHPRRHRRPRRPRRQPDPRLPRPGRLLRRRARGGGAAARGDPGRRAEPPLRLADRGAGDGERAADRGRDAGRGRPLGRLRRPRSRARRRRSPPRRVRARASGPGSAPTGGPLA